MWYQLRRSLHAGDHVHETVSGLRVPHGTCESRHEKRPLQRMTSAAKEARETDARREDSILGRAAGIGAPVPRGGFISADTIQLCPGLAKDDGCRRAPATLERCRLRSHEPPLLNGRRESPGRSAVARCAGVAQRSSSQRVVGILADRDVVAALIQKLYDSTASRIRHEGSNMNPRTFMTTFTCSGLRHTTPYQKHHRDVNSARPYPFGGT